MEVYRIPALYTLGLMAVISVIPAITARAANWTREFTQQVAAANEFEIEESQLALAQSSSDQVKQFAQQMIDDHASAEQKLQDAVAKGGYDQSLADTKIDATDQESLNHLKTLTGAAFDKQYVSDQIDAHRAAIDLFNDYLNRNNNYGAVRDFASKTLPTLRQHQTMAVALQSSGQFSSAQ